MAAPAIPSFGSPNSPKINNGSSAILTSAPAIFQQNSADFFRSEIIAVCGFHKIIPCENSYFHRGFYARKSYKSICFFHPFTPTWDAFSFLKFINDKHTPVLHMPAAFLLSVWNNFRSKAWHLQESVPLLLAEWQLLFP